MLRAHVNNIWLHASMHNHRNICWCLGENLASPQFLAATVKSWLRINIHTDTFWPFCLFLEHFSSAEADTHPHVCRETSDFGSNVFAVIKTLSFPWCTCFNLCLNNVPLRQKRAQFMFLFLMMGTDHVYGNDDTRRAVPADRSYSSTLAVKYCRIKLASLYLARVLAEVCYSMCVLSWKWYTHTHRLPCWMNRDSLISL